MFEKCLFSFSPQKWKKSLLQDYVRRAIFPMVELGVEGGFVCDTVGRCASCKASYTLTAKYVKTIAKCEKWEVYCGVFRFTFFAVYTGVGIRAKSQRILWFIFSWSAFVRKVKGFCGLFFRGINKTQNSYEIRKWYSECFVFRKNIRKIPAKCEIRKVYSQHKGLCTLQAEPSESEWKRICFENKHK